ncbi:MAG: hypothetical protein ACRDIE_16480 [Chloroflexota bacterium]
MNEVRPASTPSADASAREAASQSVQAATMGPATVAAGDASPAGGFSLVDAAASLAGRNGVVTDVVVGGNNQIAAIRIIDSVTHQVVAESPPDSIARMREEVLAYQDVVRESKLS